VAQKAGLGVAESSPRAKLNFFFPSFWGWFGHPQLPKGQKEKERERERERKVRVWPFGLGVAEPTPRPNEVRSATNFIYF
jgi:hypothetical protein